MYYGQLENSQCTLYNAMYNVQCKPAQLLGFRVDGFIPLLLFCYSPTNISRGLFFFNMGNSML